MTAYILFDRLADTAEITHPTPDPEYPIDNMLDWFTYTWWKSAGTTNSKIIMILLPVSTYIDYWAIASHDINLPDRSVYMQYWSYSADDWVTFGDRIYPPNNAPMVMLRPGEGVTSDTFRLLIISIDTTNPFIGAYSLGQALALPEGIRAPFVPPPVAYDNKIINSVSQTGQFLGRSIERYGEKMTIHQNQVDPAWMRANWADMADAIETQPFFYCWNYEEYPEDSVYAWLDDALTPPHYTNSIHTSFELKCKSLHRMRWF